MLILVPLSVLYFSFADALISPTTSGSLARGIAGFSVNSLVAKPPKLLERRVTTFLQASTSLSNLPSNSSTVEESRISPAEKSSSMPGGGAAVQRKLRKLKDLMWVREALEDLTAAEFACSVEAQDGEPTTISRRRRRAVDYEKLLANLNRRLRDLGCGSFEHKTDVSCALQSGVGMGSIVYSDEQRQALLERLIRTRELLVDVIRGYDFELDEESVSSFSISLPEIRVEIPREEDPSSPGPKLYVRDDGTVDWDGALQDQAALRKFGTAVWARINGRDPESVDEETVDSQGHHEHKPKVVTAKIEETPQIKKAREKLDALKKEKAQMESAHTALLNSALREGQAVANVNLATLQPKLRNKIRASAEAIEKMNENVSFETLVYELERIYTYLLGELGNPATKGYISLQDRLNVAEFGLLESQIESFQRHLDAGESIDSDVLAVVMDQVTDFKRRLGIDYYVTGLSFDGDGIKRWLAELLEKTKNGLAFYVKGVRLFWNDLVFCTTLVSRAAQGYTLKPREVRNIR